MTASEQMIVRVLREHGSLTLCEMYEHLNKNSGHCELDGPLLRLENRGILRDDGMRQCAWGHNRVYALNRTEQQPLPDMVVKPTRPLPEPPARMSAAAENAEQIGELQGRVSQLEGLVDSLFNSHVSLQHTVAAIQEREMERMQERLDAIKESVPG